MEALRDGHKVQHWVKRTVKGDINPAGKGILPRIEDWEKYMGWADIIIPTDNNFPIRQLETYRKKGFPIFGPNMAGADLELNRTLGLNVLEKAQIHSAPYKEFSSYSDAIAHIKAQPKKRFVCKPCGDLAKELSYVSKSGQDMVFMLEKWASQGKPKCNFILQEFVGGIEVAVGAWMGASGFSQYVCEGFEFKKLMPGNWGPNTGEMGSSLKYTTNSQLFKETLELFEDHLVYTGYTGFIDLAFIIDEAGEPRPLEWTSRFGWPTRNIQAEMHRGDSIRWMKDLLDGFDTLKIVGEDQVGTGFAVCIPDFPYKTARDSTGYPIYGLEKAKGVHLCEVMMGTAPTQDGSNITNQKMIVSSGTAVADVCANGPTVSESAKIAYDRVKQLEIPNSPIVRDDIGERLEKELPVLQKYGYMKSWKY
jgi:phosphoribosylamine--glycine ligase